MAIPNVVDDGCFNVDGDVCSNLYVSPANSDCARVNELPKDALLVQPCNTVVVVIIFVVLMLL